VVLMAGLLCFGLVSTALAEVRKGRYPMGRMSVYFNRGVRTLGAGAPPRSYTTYSSPLEYFLPSTKKETTTITVKIFTAGKTLIADSDKLKNIKVIDRYNFTIPKLEAGKYIVECGFVGTDDKGVTYNLKGKQYFVVGPLITGVRGDSETFTIYGENFGDVMGKIDLGISSHFTGGFQQARHISASEISLWSDSKIVIQAKLDPSIYKVKLQRTVVIGGKARPMVAWY